MKNYIKKLFDLVLERIGIAEILRMLVMERNMEISKYLNDYLYQNPKYTESNRLNRYEFSIRSQDGGDGIIREIFRRIGVTNKNFVEFGVGDGLQNNTVALLLEGWTGTWFEGDTVNFNKVKNNLSAFINNEKLKLIQAFITRDNVEELFKKNDVQKEFDFLSIDIDGNDYWILRSINYFKPRVLVIEYNAAYGPNISVVPKYDDKYFWKRTHFYGSSILAINKLAKEKGYSLVACTFLGNNAYFVRNDIVNNKFDLNLSVSDLYEEHKPFLLYKRKYSNDIQEVVNI